MTQTLDSLQKAGLTHLHRPPPPEDVPSAAAGPTDTPAASSAPSPDTQAPETAETTQIMQNNDPLAALDVIRREVAACTRCAELASSRTQTVFGVGSPTARLAFLGEAPGADEDRQGEPFVGRAGKLLTDMITRGMKLRREDVYILNILRCRPPGNRNPLPVEAAACREYLDRTLAVIKPEFICCLGAVAAQNLLQTDTTIGRLRGSFHDYQEMRVICTYHPAYLLRNPAAKKHTWDDLKLLMAEMGLDVPE